MANFPTLSESLLVQRLAPPRGRVSMVLDTDTYNEIDDQFAVVYSLLSPEHLDVQAIYAAPFHNGRSNGPADGMQKSYEEIERLLSRLGKPMDVFVFKGSTLWMAGPDEPVPSPAAQDLIARAMAQPADQPLYVVPIGAPTNIASAILLEPRIIERIVVCWLGGHASDWPKTDEFNMRQDLHASRILMDSGVPLVRFPCSGVVDMLRTTLAELERYVAGCGAIGDYLVQIYREYVPDKPAQSKVIWDLAPIAWLINPRTSMTVLRPSPILTDACTWSFNAQRHLIREAVHIDRDAIFRDLFQKLASVAG